MSFLHGIVSLLDALPLASVSAITLLIVEGVRAYMPEEEGAIAIEKLKIDSQTTGEKWLKKVLDVAADMMEERESINQQQLAWVVRAVNDFVEENFHKDLTLTELANQVNYNPSYLSRSYKKQTNKNIMSYVKEVRLHKAKAMLIESNKRVADIAQECGFFSTRYFNTAFKKEIGIAPNTYREKKGKI